MAHLDSQLVHLCLVIQGGLAVLWNPGLLGTLEFLCLLEALAYRVQEDQGNPFLPLYLRCLQYMQKIFFKEMTTA